MTRGATIATTFLFSIFYLKNKSKRNQIWGSILAILGVIVVGISNVIYSKSSQPNENVLMTLSRIINMLDIFY